MGKTMTGRSSKVVDWCWWIGWAAVSSVWCLGAAAEIGTTFDETSYVRFGVDAWRRGTHETFMRIGTMPLPADVATLPLYLYERITGARLDLRGPDFANALFWARVTSLVFWWQLLFFAGVIGRHLAGPWGGRLSIALLACEPNFLAHASLATTDIAAAAFLLPTAYFFALGREQAWWRRIGIPSLWFGAALFAKASALAYGPLAWLIIESHRLAGRGAFRLPADKADESPTLWRRFRHALAQYRPWWSDAWRIGSLGMVMVFLLCGCDWTTQPSWVAWAHGLPDGTFGKDTMVWLADNLKIFSNAGHGLVYQIRHNMRGHSSYLLGEVAERSLWYYYPVLLTIKLPLPILALPLIIALVRPRALGNWACAIAAGLFLYSLNCKVQIGIRLMLPWIALGIVGLAAALVNACQELQSLANHPLTPSPSHPLRWRRRLLGSVASAAIAWLAVSAAAIWPHGLCYVNELWGGPERGYTLVSDSNYDWGQGLKELALWQQEHHVENLDVWYFGTDPLLAKLPMRPIQAANLSTDDLLEKVRGHYLAVGTSWLHGSYAPLHSEVPPTLQKLQPVGRTKTFLIYDFTKPTLAAQNAGVSPVPSRRN